MLATASLGPRTQRKIELCMAAWDQPIAECEPPVEIGDALITLLREQSTN